MSDDGVHLIVFLFAAICEKSTTGLKSITIRRKRLLRYKNSTVLPKIVGKYCRPCPQTKSRANCEFLEEEQHTDLLCHGFPPIDSAEKQTGDD